MPVRSRDLRRLINEMGFEKGVVHFNELLCEELVGLRESMAAMAAMQAQTVDILSELADAGGAMKSHLQALERKNDQYNSVSSISPSNDC